MKRTQERFPSFFRRRTIQRGTVLGGMLLLALVAFEIFNYSTTNFALTDLLGNNLRFAGLRWSTILALAFCGIDFAGLARLFTPELAKSEPVETWYLFSAWLLAAAMNAVLTWWGVAVAVRTHIPQADGTILSQQVLLSGIPIFVAVMVGVIRILIIGTFAKGGERIFRSADARREDAEVKTTLARPTVQGNQNYRRPAQAQYASALKPRPIYHPVGLTARSHNKSNALRR